MKTMLSPLLAGVLALGNAACAHAQTGSSSYQDRLADNNGPGVKGKDSASYAQEISDLVGLAKPWEPGDNDRVVKYVALLAEAKQAGLAPEDAAVKAVELATMVDGLRKLTAEAMVRILKMAEEMGCLDAEGLAFLMKGEATTVRRDCGHYPPPICSLT